ncbi:bifunctional apoptosis regulator [Esox lucius]|uniref:Bifunctional apoptosis regulator n=1 Tax=Esox lucius TaxID=8010 RepID=A0AAY5KZ42_ESOLU|nr:bifunctional apoptosis regulator [Esox lucius]XP_028977947.2 bifunctional apoptosis regulator [Esox lucius]XP_028977948.2 bifunctional apoptosis regulator [Esox lucius]
MIWQDTQPMKADDDANSSAPHLLPALSETVMPPPAASHPPPSASGPPPPTSNSSSSPPPPTSNSSSSPPPPTSNSSSSPPPPTSNSSSSPRLRSSASPLISEDQFACHCCYDILVNPTTLNCGHSFCRHCLALWWESSRKTECPECREKWEGFPKVNILLRDAVERLFQDVVERRRAEIHGNPKTSQCLLAFQRYGDEQIARGPTRNSPRRGAGGFFSGVLTALTCVAVVLLVYHWSSGDGVHDLLVSKPVSKWTPEEVLFWLENLGAWASLYKDPFLQENVNGRLLLMLGDEELTRHPYNIENLTHRRAILAELDRVKELGVKPPQNLWEYKAVNAGKSLFLLYSLKSSPRLTMLYLYLFDYSETFLPFLHTCCPPFSPASQPMEDGLLPNNQVHPTWHQWAEFLVKYLLLPYQLIAEFAWDWLSVHYWTSRFIIVNAVLLSVLEGCALWRLYSRAAIRSLPQKMWGHFWRMFSQGFAFALFWPVTPQFVCNCLFYWALYFNPIINIDLVVQQVLHPDTQVP